MNIGMTIRSIRKANKLRQRHCAKYVGITESALNQIETGVTEPRYSTLVKIAGALKVSVAMLYFLSLTSDDYKTKAEIKFMINKLIERL